MRSPTRVEDYSKLWLGLALAFAGVAACSAEPLMPGQKGGSGGAAGQGGAGDGSTGIAGTTGAGGTSGTDCARIPLPAIACAVGRTVPVCTVDASGKPTWVLTCPDDPTGSGGAIGGSTGAGGAAGGSTGAGGAIGGSTGAGGAAGGSTGAAGAGGANAGVPCASTQSCAKGEVCTTEDGDCKAPPGCTGGVACPAVCYGVCRPADAGPACGTTRCAAGLVCCNASCGICTEPNAGCTKQLCPVPVDNACSTDADCRVEADYCTGCDCRALGRKQSLPACPGPGVRCLVDPCGGKKAQCVGGLCVVAP